MAMIKMQLGRLQQVSAREVFGHESLAFTPWLAEEENLQMLSEALNIPLELQGQEQWVGAFRADILARNTETDGLVLIENQLEKTDHCHLGQIITYAAGLEANTIVWIAESFTPEHRTALDWLNKNTAAVLQFFAVQIEVWKIGESAPAPKFEVVAKPNDWAQAIQQGVKRTRVNPEQIRQLLDAEPGLSGRKIADRLGCSPTTAAKWKDHFENGSGQQLAK
jgi:hypothetical protein